MSERKDGLLCQCMWAGRDMVCVWGGTLGSVCVCRSRERDLGT